MTDDESAIAGRRGPEPERLKIDAPEGWEAVAGALARKPKSEPDDDDRDGSEPEPTDHEE